MTMIPDDPDFEPGTEPGGGYDPNESQMDTLEVDQPHTSPSSGTRDRDSDFELSPEEQRWKDYLASIASGETESEAEIQARKLTNQLMGLNMGLARTQRGSRPGGAFSAAAQRSGMVESSGLALQKRLEKQSMARGKEAAMLFDVSMSGQERGYNLEMARMQFAEEQADQAEAQGWFSSVINVAGSVLMMIALA